MKTKPIDYELINEYFDYNPESGMIILKKRSKYNHQRKVGDIVGSLKSTGYISVRFKGREYSAHRLAMVLHNGEDIPEGMVVDHINHNRSDNRLSNLRVVTVRENNSHLKNPGTSKYTGVCWHKWKKCWVSQIGINGENVVLGSFNTEWEAHIAYQTALNILL